MPFGEDGGALPDTASRQSQLAFLGLRSARLHAPAAFWASWADSLSAIQRRDPDLAQNIVRKLEPDVPCCRVLDTLKATVTLLARQGFEAPQWHHLLGDDAPQPHDVEDDAPGIGRGWQKAAAALDLQSAAAHGNNLDAASASMLLSQSGPCSAQVFLMLPVCPELILEPAHFRVSLLRRLRSPLLFVPARCRCGREQDALGDHRSACPRSGVLRARGGPLERAAARICREAGAVVATHTLVRDLNVGSVPGDDRRIEVIANGLLLWGGMQLAVDTTLVSALSSTLPEQSRGRSPAPSPTGQGAHIPGAPSP